jgi:hypothetical protein
MAWLPPASRVASVMDNALAVRAYTRAVPNIRVRRRLSRAALKQPV